MVDEQSKELAKLACQLEINIKESSAFPSETIDWLA